MDILAACDYLEQAIVSSGLKLPMSDNLVLKPRSLPCIVIEPEASSLLAHGYGSTFSGENELTIWVIVPIRSSIRAGREELINYLEKVLCVPRLYVSEGVKYGIDIIWDEKVVFGRITGKVA